MIISSHAGVKCFVHACVIDIYASMTYNHVMISKINIIKDLRMKSGLSQQGFAEKFNIPVSTLRQWEQGRRKAPEYVYSLISAVMENEPAASSVVVPANTWQLERNNRYVFPVVVDNQDFQIEKIHPLNQAKAVRVFNILKKSTAVSKAYIFGSSTNLRCRIDSDIDLAILLKNNSNNWNVKGKLSEEISKACEWQCDIVWMNDMDKNSQLYNGIVKGEQII